MTGISPVVLLILDGFGHRDATEANAIAAAHTPTYDRWRACCPQRLLDASGAAAGLPDGQMGNSEVGHITLGSGRVTQQSLPRISADLAAGGLANNAAWRAGVARLRAGGGCLHLWGLVSPGGVHSHEAHLLALIAQSRSDGVAELRVHAVLDGRDVPPRSAEASLARVEAALATHGYAPIADLCGRFYAMDRDQRWERTAQAWRLYVQGQSAGTVAATAREALHQSYARGDSDEFCLPTATAHFAAWKAGDEVLMFNFRADRARQLERALWGTSCDFARGQAGWPSRPITMTPYQEGSPAPVLYRPPPIDNGLGSYVAARGCRQYRIAETEKYAHVTYFFNGGREQPCVGETRTLIPSPKVKTYDLQPAMSVREVTAALCKALDEGVYHLLVCNFANGDMVGHTGNFAAAVAAVEAIDACLAVVERHVRAAGGHLLLTADHGNVECMYDQTAGQQHTAHTSAPVPLLYVGADEGDYRFADGDAGLCDVAPTLLQLLGLPQPQEMTGRGLLVRSDA